MPLEAEASKKNAGNTLKSVYEPATVRDRVERWQSYNAAESSRPGSPLERPKHPTQHVAQARSTRPRAETTSLKKTETAPPPVYQTQSLTPSRSRLDPDVRSASTPKKRVVSDEHWMKSRAAPSTSAKRTPDKAAKMGRHQIVDWAPEESGPKKCDAWVRPKPVPKAPKEQEQKPTPNPTKTKKTTPKAQASRPVKRTSEKDSIAANDNPGSERVVSSESTPTKATTKPNSADASPDPDGLDIKKLKSSAKAKTPTKTPPKSTPPKQQQHKPSGGRIENWLGDMPDPFVEDPKTLAKAIKAPPSVFGELSTAQDDRDDRSRADSEYERAERRRRRKARAKSAEVENQPSATRPPRMPREAPEPSVAHDDAMSSAASTPSTGLKRRGARHKSASKPKEEKEPAPEQEVVLSTARVDENSLSRQLAALPQEPPGLSHHLTTHDDLISVLSEMPRKTSNKLRPSNSVLKNKGTPQTASTEPLMKELKDDEVKYLRELRTLVDGVIPVLLKTAISSSESLTGNRKNSAKNTNVIVSMGIALEKLKGSHKRIPTSSHVALLIWAQNNQVVYAEYLKAWRLGFDDIMVNLAPAEHHPSDARFQPEWASKQHGGNLLEDERADVAYLLKRPLVRLKYLAKTFRSLEILTKSDHASKVAEQYESLVKDAKHRQKEEQGRIEDEAASNIDASRARDTHTLAPLAGVQIDQSRCVKARDVFDMKLLHSNGQRIDCKVELILRDDRWASSSSGDLLVCEMDLTSRWLLLPPVARNRVSARMASQGEIVVMIRGQDIRGQDWHELLTLHAEDEQMALDWMQMLGTTPVPPQVRKFAPAVPKPLPSRSETGRSALHAYVQQNADLPIGEPSMLSGTHSSKPPSLAFTHSSASSLGSQNDEGVPKRRAKSSHGKQWPEDEWQQQVPEPQIRHSWSQHSFSDVSGNQPSTPTRYKHRSAGLPIVGSADHEPKSDPRFNKSRGFPQSPEVLRPTSQGSESQISTTPHDYEAVRRQTTRKHDRNSELDPRRGRSTFDLPLQGARGVEDEPKEPSKHRRVHYAETDTSYDERREPAAHPSILSRVFRGRPISPELNRPPDSCSPPSARRSRAPDDYLPQGSSVSKGRSDQSLPRDPVSVTTQSSHGHYQRSASPELTPPPVLPAVKRRSSSPLKHEYTPSIASRDDDDGKHGFIEDDDDESINSDESEDDIVPSLAPSFTFRAPKVAAPHTVYSPTTPNTLAPSESASQSPYRSVPEAHGANNECVASIFCWSDKGAWERVHADECSIVVSPGLIEAFDLRALHTHASRGDRAEDKPLPLVAQELTPLVPLRRSTAIDISVRSPLTHNSQLSAGNNIMFRSRNGQECDILYGLINQARINNPTYIALQNARGPFNDETQWGPQSRSTRKWFGLGRRRSYRAGSDRPRPFTDTESSVATMTSTASALRRFAGSKMFNVAKSTITSRHRSRASTDFSSSSGDNSGTTTPVPVGPNGEIPSIGNMKMRLYIRESAQRWRDLGSAKMTIMQPERPPGQQPLMARDGTLIQHKRIVVLGSTAGETLLDVTLGEGSFERVARTGIAVSVKDELRSKDGEIVHIQTTGGVNAARIRVFMLQMKSEADAAYAFSLVGRLRY